MGGLPDGLCFARLEVAVGTPFLASRGWFSFAPSGLAVYSFLNPTACAVGCILSPLRGWFEIAAGGRIDLNRRPQ